jgi:hypothetical protein
VDPGGFGASQQRSHVLGVLEGVENEHERRLAALQRTGEDVVEAGVRPRLDGQGDALVAVESGERGQRAAFDLDDRDPEARGVQDEPFECLPALRDDEQAMGGPPRDERFLDGPAPGDQLLVGPEQVEVARRGGRRLTRTRRRTRTRQWTPRLARPWTARRTPGLTRTRATDRTRAAADAGPADRTRTESAAAIARAGVRPPAGRSSPGVGTGGSTGFGALRPTPSTFLASPFLNPRPGRTIARRARPISIVPTSPAARGSTTGPTAGSLAR